MARKVTGREAGLLIALGAAVVVYLWYGSRPDASTALGTVAAGGRAAAGTVDRAPAVRMDLLARRAAEYDPQGRDLFKYAVRPPTAEELRLQREAAERQRKLLEMEAKARLEAAERDREAAAIQAIDLAKNPPKPQPPVIALKYVGYMGPKHDKIAVFNDGDEVIVAKRGETVKGQFTVVEIKFESVVMGYTRPEFSDMTRELPLAPVSR